MYYEFEWQKILSGQYLQWLLQGFQISISLMLLSSLIAVVLGILLTFGQLSRYRVIRFISFIYIELCRNIPTLIWMLFFYYVLPEFFSEPVKTMLNTNPALNYWAAIAGLSVSSSGYISEILRGGISGVSKEQIFAAYTLGHSRWEVWKYIIWPQAIRISFPPLVSRLIHNMKNSSLALALSVHEILWAIQQIESITFRGIEVTIIATLFFLTINYVASLLALLAEKSFYPMKNKEKKVKCVG
ncbi:amino acid ABC transporter permease [Acetivibrio straminisolvens]|uniref:amino acid ABC transporter permease n=1 Tax=Acetivibrio straminisolvens TaxID=253314 RepID=UPI00223E9B9E|nr:amino acid ABC transporter permease [Acetivibrio straminisolvens]HOV25694.1 amino acid ABC transporter permease [Pseudobacteroides sp.]